MASNVEASTRCGVLQVGDIDLRVRDWYDGRVCAVANKICRDKFLGAT